MTMFQKTMALQYCLKRSDPNFGSLLAQPHTPTTLKSALKGQQSARNQKILLNNWRAK